MPPRPVSRRATLLAGLAALALLGAALWLIGGQLARPYVYDDVSFILGAQAVAETGRPYGDQGYMLHLYGQREQWALWHPPLYILTLGLVVALFGEGEPAARSLGILALLLCAGLAFDLARRAVREAGGGPGRELAAGVLAVALYTLNPLAVQASLLLDIDNTVLMLLIALQVWLAIRLPGLWSGRAMVGLGLLYGLSLWAKLTTPLALAAALAFTRLFQGTGWRGALQALGVAGLGWLLFLASWLGVSAAAGWPIDYTLEVVRNEALESGASSRDRLVSLEAFIQGVAPAILWIGPFCCLLFVAAGLPRLVSLLRGAGLRAADLLVVLGAAIYLAYIFKLAGGFPKYHAAMLPLWAAASGALVARTAGRPGPFQLGVAVLGTVLLGWWLVPRIGGLWDTHWSPALNVELVIVPLALGLGIAAAWALAGRRSLLGAVPVALCALTLVWSVGLDLAQRERIGSTTYYYGRYGQRETAAALDALLQPGEVYVASKDVAWYARERHYVDQESWQYVVWEVQHAAYDDTYLGMPIRVLALAVGDPSLRAAYDGLLFGRGYQHVGQHGNYLIYLRP